MSERHWELKPSRWPTEGMISEASVGVVLVVGVTGVTRVTETGVFFVDTPCVVKPVESRPSLTVTITVAVNVAVGRPVGSMGTVRRTLFGGRGPLAGVTATRELSVV